MIVKCKECGDVKVYKTKNKRRCPFSINHHWRYFKKDKNEE